MKIPITNQNLCKTHIIGKTCQQNELDVEHVRTLREARFRWVGISSLQTPYRMVRLRSVHSHIVACLQGQGRAWIDGQWVAFEAGQVLLGPVGCLHAFEAIDGADLTLAWVFYDDTELDPVLTQPCSQLIRAESSTFAQVLRSLLQEAAGIAQEAAMNAWTHLLDIHTRRMVGLELSEDRLGRAWLNVEQQLAYPWTAGELAAVANVSEEHFRRLCHKQYQRSPMKHLTHLRMTRASTLLRSTSEKNENIAQAVGYASMYSFSVAFKRWKGLSPRDVRNVIHRGSMGCPD